MRVATPLRLELGLELSFEGSKQTMKTVIIGPGGVRLAAR
jgi:hypothetical protein